jgi:hypothetical protein
MDTVETEKARKAFEELLSAYWAAQLAQLHAQPNSDDTQNGPDAQKTNGKEGDAR